MSGSSPARRFRSKTSDISDFLRNTPPQHVQGPPVPTLPQQQPSPVKKRRIPFLSRKKTFASLTTANISAPIQKTSPATKPDASRIPRSPIMQRVPISTTTPSEQRCQKVPTGDSQNSNDSTSLTARSSFISTLPPVNFSPPSLSPLTQPDQSVTSTASLGSEQSSVKSGLPSTRSLNSTFAYAQRQNQPLITASVPLTEAVRSDRQRAQSHVTGPAAAPTIQRSNSARHMGTPPLSDTPRMGFPMPPRTHLDMKGGRSETDGAICASDNAHVNSAIERPHRSGTKASLTARKELAQAVGKSVDYGTEANKTEGKLDTSGAGSFDVPRSAPPIVATTSLSDEKVSTSRTQFSTSKISRKAISFGKAPSGPPTIPLPTPPAVMASEISTDLSSSPSDTSLLLPSTPVRTRSNTSIPLPNSATFTRRSLLTVKGDIAGDTDLALPAKVIMAKVESGIERASKDGDRINPKLLAQDSDASSEQLRRALLSQLAKFDHLAGYVLSLTQKHEDEKTSLVQRIEELQREIKKRDREIKGLRWLVVNGAAVAGQSGSTPGSAPTTGQRERSLSSSHSRQSTVETIGQQLRREYADDSEKCYLTPALEAESPTTGSLDNSDGATVLQRSSTVKHTLAPGSQACGWRLSPKQFRRKSSPVVNVYGKAEPGAGLGLGMGPLPPATTSSDSEVVSARSALGTRASSSSLSSSASTVPTMTAASTASSGLSAILESPPQSSDGTSEFPRSIIPEEGKRREKDERRAIKALRRISSSSSKSGSSVHVTATPPCPPLPPDAAASTSYASNLRKGAMPSIDNVLGRSVTDEKMEHVLARLRLLGEAVNR